MKNQGISLITLIITIIVIIILAAIVIFTGLGTPDSANFAHYCQDVDNVQSAVLNAFADLKVSHSTENNTRTDEQIYMEIALGDSSKVSQYSTMTNDKDDTTAATSLAASQDNACQHIVLSDLNTGKAKSSLLKINLPKVRENRNSWYITKKGQVFNTTGYLYKNDGTPYYYFTANLKTDTELNAVKDATYGANDEKSGAKKDRAAIIATALNTDSALGAFTNMK